MIQASRHMRIFVAREPIDARKGIDGTAGVCRKLLEQNPYSGAMFVFINRRCTRIRIYLFDGQAEWLCDKRFCKGRHRHWPRTPESLMSLTPEELLVLIGGGDPGVVSRIADWKRIESPHAALTD